MSYQGVAAGKALQSNDLYRDRYRTGDTESHYDGDVPVTGEDFFSDASEDIQTPGNLRQLAQGSSGASDTTDYLGELNDLSGDLNETSWADSEQSNTTPAEATAQLTGLIADINHSKLPASIKEDLLKKAQDLLKKLKAGALEDFYEIDDLKSDFSTAVEENPSIEKRLAQSLSEAGTDLNEAQVTEALKAAGLNEDKLAKIHFPINREDSTALVLFFKKIDPTFSDLFESEPYGEDSINRMKELVGATMPGQKMPSEENIVSILDQTVTVVWDEAAFEQHLSGDWIDSHRRFLHAVTGEVTKAFSSVPTVGNAREAGGIGALFGGPLGAIGAAGLSDGSDPLVANGWAGALLGGPLASILMGMQQEGISDLHGYMWSGFNDWDRGQNNRNDEVRRLVSTIYEASGHNPYLFRRYMKMLPDQILQDFRDTVIYHTGELTEKHSGDRFDSQTTSSIVDWVLSGGDMPSELKGDSHQVENAVPSPLPGEPANSESSEEE